MNLKEFIKTKKFEVISFFIAVSITVGAYFLQTYYPVLPQITFIIIFGFLVLILWFKAGQSIFKTFIELSSTAGIVISITIFIVQQYCALPSDKQIATGSLANLYAFGLIYSLYLFVNELSRQIKKDIDELKEINNDKHSLLILILYLGLVFLFLWQFYAVLSPIILNFCIFQNK